MPKNIQTIDEKRILNYLLFKSLHQTLVFILFIYILGAYCGIRLRVDMGRCGRLPHSYLGAGRRYLVRAERSPPADRGQQTVRERKPRVCVDGVRARRVGSAAE